MARKASSGIESLLEAGRRTGLGSEELMNFQESVLQDNISMRSAEKLMQSMINRQKRNGAVGPVLRNSADMANTDIIGDNW